MESLSNENVTNEHSFSFAFRIQMVLDLLYSTDVLIKDDGALSLKSPHNDATECYSA